MTSTNLTVKDGLAGDNVYFAMQDTQGYIWFSTETGVSRYNGRTFENFFMSDGLADNEIFRMDEDSQGRIWFSAFNGKLSYYWNGKFYNNKNDPALAKIKPTGHYINFFESSDGTVWFATPREYFNLTRDGNNSLSTNIPGAGLAIYAFLEENSQVRGYARRAEVIFNRDSLQKSKAQYFQNGDSLDVFRKYLFNTPEYLTQFNNSLPNSLLEQESGTRLPESAPISKVINYPDKMWFCSHDGVYALDLKTKVTETFFNGYMTTHVLKDRENGYWFATLGNGVFYTPSLKNRAISTYEGDALDMVTSIIDNGEKLYFGGILGKFGEIDGEKVLIRDSVQVKGRVQAKKIIVDFNGDFLIAAETFLIKRKGIDLAQLWRLDVKTIEKWRDLYVLGDRRNLYGLNAVQLERVMSLDEQERRFSGILSRPTNATTFLIPQTGYVFDMEPFKSDLLVATAKGLFVLDSLFNYSRVQSAPIAGERINDILALNDNSYAIATHGFGVFINRNDEWIEVSNNQGLASNICRRIWSDGSDTLWVATNSGISRIVAANDEVNVSNISETDGLLTEEVNDLIVKDDLIYAGTSKGISVIDLQNWNNESVSPLINFKEMTVNGQVVSNSDTLFKSNTKNIELKYDGLHFRSLDRVDYRYRVIGLDDQWISTKANSINFGKLAPGSYTFQVKAVSAQGNESEFVSRTFVIKEPFWLTWWFFLASLLSLIWVVYLLIRIFVQRSKRQAQREFDFKMQLAEAERKALQSQLNPHFIFNSLNSIQNMVLKFEADQAYDYLEKFSTLIRRVLEFSEISMIPLRDELTTLELYLELEKMRLDDEFTYKINVDPSIQSLGPIPTMIIQPFVENAIWHGIMPLNGLRKGEIKIMVSEHNESLRVLVVDNGVGRDPSKKEKGWGSQMAKDLAQLSGGSDKARVEVIDLEEDGKPCGTKVIVDILKKVEAYV